MKKIYDIIYTLPVSILLTAACSFYMGIAENNIVGYIVGISCSLGIVLWKHLNKKKSQSSLLRTDFFYTSSSITQLKCSRIAFEASSEFLRSMLSNILLWNCIVASYVDNAPMWSIFSN